MYSTGAANEWYNKLRKPAPVLTKVGGFFRAFNFEVSNVVGLCCCFLRLVASEV